MADVLWKRRGGKGTAPPATLLGRAADEGGRKPVRCDEMKFLRSVKDLGWTG
jgi:hypothetical protein